MLDHLKKSIITAYKDNYPDGLVPPREAAKIVRFAPETLATMRSRGGGPQWIKSGRKVYYTLEGLAEWFANRSVKKH